MKRILVLLLVMTLLLGGCGGTEKDPAPQVNVPAQTEPVSTTVPETTAEPTTEPTTVPTTEPIIYRDPLNGEILDAPFDGRIYASTVANTRDSLPHVNAWKADILMEMYVNGSNVRCLALFSDLSDVEALGSTRSTRLMFNDIAQHYDAILTHAGGSATCIRDAKDRGITNYNVDSLMRQQDPLMKGVAYRDKDHKEKYGENNLYVVGPGVMAYAESQGVQLTGLPERDYGFLFTEDGTPVSGEDAPAVQITLVYGQARKNTTMVYDPETGRYTYYQFEDILMKDLMTGEPETFRNVVVMITQIDYVYGSGAGYHQADFVSGGTGYYACGGKIIPLIWTCEDENSPFRYFTADGEPLAFSEGNTYIAVCSPDSTVTWEPTELPAK